MTGPPGILVAKLGGSLLDWPGLPGALTAFLGRVRTHPEWPGRPASGVAGVERSEPPDAQALGTGESLRSTPATPPQGSAFDPIRHQAVVLIVGGGAIVDALRTFDQTHGLGEERSHALALRAMELTSHCLASLIPGLEVVDEVCDLSPAWERGSIPILSPRRFLDLDEQTSADPLPHHWDVTSDSIAARVADRLGAEALILLKSAPAPSGLDPADASRLGLVDPFFPIASRSLPVVLWFNLRDPDGEEILLQNLVKKM